MNSKKIFSFVLIILVLVSVLCNSVSAQTNSYSSGELENLIDGIAASKMAETNTDSVQELIDNGLSQSAGTGSAEWYIVALRQYKNSYDYTDYKSAINKYVTSNTSSKSTDLQRIAIACAAIGGNANFIQNTIDNTIGKLGVMSYVYGLILLDSGAYTSSSTNRNDIINNILSQKLPDGGWALSGKTSDIDVTAMTVQALAPYYQFDDVKTAVDNALTLLSNRQLENGDFSSWGTRSAESTAQVIVALSALNINCETESRFIKNGNTLIDGLLLYKLPDGSFSHTIGGNSNNTSTAQAMYSLVAAWRQSKGLGALYKFTTQTIAREVNTTNAPNDKVDKTTSNNSQSSSTNTVTGGADASQDLIQETNSQNTLGESTSNTNFPEDILTNISENVQNEKTSVNYKVIAIITISLVVLLAIGILFLRKKNNIKNIVFAIALTAAAMLAVLFTNIQSVDDYYLDHIDDIKPDSQTVFVSISCDTVKDKLSAYYLPPDGCILAKTEYVLRDGDTAFDLLVRATKHNKIQMEYEGVKGNSLGTVYVKGINYLYEYDVGETSGWMYKVNGNIQNVGCSNCVLSEGDVVEWVYTCNLGKDVD